MELLEGIETRRSFRTFQPTLIPKEKSPVVTWQVKVFYCSGGTNYLLWGAKDKAWKLTEDTVSVKNDGSYTLNSWAQDPSVLGGGWVNYKDYFWRKFMARGGNDAPLFCDGAWLGFNAFEVDDDGRTC